MTRSPDLRLARWGLALSALALAVVTLALLAPGSGAEPRVPGLDKLLHALAFFGITLPAAAGAPRRAWALALAAAAYGGAMELIQPSFGRGAEWGDLAADALGAAAGAWLGIRLHPRLRRRFQPASG